MSFSVPHFRVGLALPCISHLMAAQTRTRCIPGSGGALLPAQLLRQPGCRCGLLVVRGRMTMISAWAGLVWSLRHRRKTPAE
jgi:hypothetical protein